MADDRRDFLVKIKKNGGMPAEMLLLFASQGEKEFFCHEKLGGREKTALYVADGDTRKKQNYLA